MSKLTGGTIHMPPSMRLRFGAKQATPAVVAIKIDGKNVENGIAPLLGVDIEGIIRSAATLQVVRFSEKDKQFLLEEFPLISFLSKNGYYSKTRLQRMDSMVMLGNKTFSRTQAQLPPRRAEYIDTAIGRFENRFGVSYTLDDMKEGKPTTARISNLPRELPDVKVYTAAELKDFKFWVRDKDKGVHLSREEEKQVKDMLHDAKRALERAEESENPAAIHAAENALTAVAMEKHLRFGEREVEDLAKGVKPRFHGKYSLEQAIQATDSDLLEQGLIDVTGNNNVEVWPIATYVDVSAYADWKLYHISALAAKTANGFLAMGLDEVEWQGTNILPDLRSSKQQLVALAKEWHDIVDGVDLKKNYKDVLRAAYGVDAFVALAKDDKDFFLALKGVGEKSADDIVNALVLHPRFMKIPEEYSVVRDRLNFVKQ